MSPRFFADHYSCCNRPKGAIDMRTLELCLRVCAEVDKLEAVVADTKCAPIVDKRYSAVSN
jgi:hypothetical protein